MVSFKKILFPTDFSANAHHALSHAVQLADFHQGELIVQHVVTDYFEKHTHWATLSRARATSVPESSIHGRACYLRMFSMSSTD